MAAVTNSKPRIISVRVEILSPGALKDRTIEPLNAFRLRLDGDSTFADLANAALARYSKEHPECSRKPVASGIFDEKNCAVDLEDGVDIIQQGEVLKLVLAPSESSTTTSTTSNNDVTTTPTSRPSQTPAVKKIRPILPGLSQALAHRSSFPPRSSGLSSSQPRSSPLDNVLPRSGQSRYVAIKTSRRPMSKGKGGKQDPYELPSDTDDNQVHNGKKSRLETANARNRLVKSEPGHNSDPPGTIDLTISTKTRSIPREANFIVIEDSSSRSTSPELSDFPRTVSLLGGPAQVRVENPSLAQHVSSNKSGKSSVSHSINDHTNFTGANRDNVEERGNAQSMPPYIVKNSQGTVPVFTRKEFPGQRSTARRPSASSISNSKSSKRAKNAGPLTLTPSRIAAATKSLHERFQQEAKARQAAKQAAALQAAHVEEENKRAKAEARRNTPSAAIAHIKSMSETKLGRKEPRKRIPDVFFHDSTYSDNEELDEDTQKATSYKPATNDAEDKKTISSTRTSRSTRPLSSAVTRSISFQPINRLWPSQEPKDQTKLQKKLAPAYSQRVHDAFADLDQSDAESSKEFQLNSGIVETTDEVTNEDTPSTPEPFQRWFTEYETNFVPHLGFCSVADGPFEGLIRSGPRKGQYLSGHISPSAAKIAEMEKTAVPRERFSNIWSSDPEAVEYDDNISDSDDEVLPSSRPQSTKSTVSSESESTSILIMRQLSQEEPPSNQELGILMSSSPSRSAIDSAHTPACHRSLQLAADHTTESPGIAATTPKIQAETHRRDSDLDITPNFERALSQVETPSTRSTSTQKTPAESSAALDNVQPATFGRIVVKVPQLSPEKQAEYKKVPDNRSRHRRSPLKSFMEINRVHEDTQIASQDSGAAAIEQILNASPSWLTSITEIEPRSSEHDSRTRYRLRRHAVNTPCHPMIESQPRPECKVDLTKNQDPTYQPSDSHSASESSADEQRERSKSTAKERASNTPEKPVRTLLFTRGPVLHPSQGPDATPKRDASINNDDPELILSTPILAPSIPELLERVKDTPSKKCFDSQTPAPEEPESVITTRLERGSPGSTMKRSTTPHPAVADFSHGAYRQTAEHHNKRKHEDDIHALSLEQGHSSSHRKKRKKHEGGESTDKSRQCAKKGKRIRAKKKDTSQNQSMVLNKTQPPHRGGPNEVCTPETHGEPVVTVLFQRFDQSHVSQAHMYSPEIPDVVENQVGSATHDLSKASGISDPHSENRGSKKEKRQKDRKKNRKQKRIGQPNEPASRAQSNSFHHRNAQMPKLTTQHSADVKPGKERGSKKTQTTKARIPRSADKLPSPPITSRPSSAGSAF